MLKKAKYIIKFQRFYLTLNWQNLKRMSVKMTDFSKILEKAKEVEAKMKESQEKIKQIEVIGVSGGDAVKVTLNGEGEMINLELSDEVIKEDKGILLDLIKAAHSNAKSQLKSKTSDEISKATGGFGIPGFKWPLQLNAKYFRN